MIYIFLSILLFALNNVLWKKNLQNCSVTFLVGYRALFTSIGSTVVLLYLYSFVLISDNTLIINSDSHTNIIVLSSFSHISFYFNLNLLKSNLFNELAFLVLIFDQLI